MFLKTRKRFIAILMIVLVIINVSTLGIIYFTTGYQTRKENKEMLEIFAESYDENGFPTGSFFQPLPDDEKIEIEFKEPPVLTDSIHRYQVSTFYAVSFNLDYSVKELLNDVPSSLSDEELVYYASQILESGKTYGTGDTYTYIVTTGDDYILVTMMDTIVIDRTISYLTINMIVLGAISLAILFFVSIYLSKWMIAPTEEAYKKQKQFISDAGHELKTPISTINANLELLKREYPKDDWLKNIAYENDRMSTIVHQLLDLARLENITPVMSEVNLSELCFANIMPFEATAFENEIFFDYEIEDNVIITGDQTNLEKLISILTDNAISHCPKLGEVHIRLFMESGKVHFTAANTGVEIPVEEREKIFERFYKSDSARAESKGHYGLGLSIAKAVVLEHKGKISVDYQNNMVIFTAVI